MQRRFTVDTMPHFDTVCTHHESICDMKKSIRLTDENSKEAATAVKELKKAGWDFSLAQLLNKVISDGLKPFVTKMSSNSNRQT